MADREARLLDISAGKRLGHFERYTRQTYSLRWIVVSAAGVIVSLLMWVMASSATRSLERRTEHYYTIECPPCNEAISSLLIFSPIVAATAIIIFLLIGVFRGFRSDEMDSSPAQLAARATTGAGSSAGG